MVSLIVRHDPDLIRIHVLAAVFFYTSIVVFLGLLYKIGSGIQTYIDL